MPPVATSVRPCAPVSSVPPPASQKSPRRLGESPHATPVPPHRNATDDEILGLAPLNVNDARSDSAESSKRARRTTSPTAASTIAPGSPDSFDDAALANRTADDQNTEQGTAGANDASADSDDHASSSEAIPAELQAVLDANPDLRRAWDDRESYRQFFATPEEARAATAQLRDLDRMDALFFSRRPEDHAELAAAVAALDPAAFASLAQAMSGLASNGLGVRVQGAENVTLHQSVGNENSGYSPSTRISAAPNRVADATHGTVASAPNPERTLASQQLLLNENLRAPISNLNPTPSTLAPPSPAQTEFFHATNAAAVESVLGAIESQVEKLLPEGVSKNARSRVVGEIYRELDTTLRSNRQFTQQLRDAMGSALAQPDGGRDANHQRAIVSLIAGRARQALPAVAKRVLNEWTSTIVAANQERRGRQRAAEHRVDIAGSSGAGNDGRRPLSPREIDYARMSDADILNL